MQTRANSKSGKKQKALQSFSNLHAATLMRTETWHCSAVTPCSIQISIPDAKGQKVIYLLFVDTL